MNLAHLKFFCDAVFYGSISEAAKINFVSQSAVSQAIAKLEIVLGVELLIHSRQKFQVSEIGRVVFEQSGKIFKNLDEVHTKIAQKNEIFKGILKCAATKSLGMAFLPLLYLQTKKKLPGITLNFSLGGRNYIRNALRQYEVEFAIVVYDESFSQFARRSLRKGRINLYQSNSAPNHLIEQGIFVDYLEDPYVKQLRDHLSCTDRHQIQIVKELTSWEAVARFTEAGICIGFFPDYILAHNRYPTIQLCPIEIPHFEYEICAIYNKEAPLSSRAIAVLDQFEGER